MSWGDLSERFQKATDAQEKAEVAQRPPADPQEVLALRGRITGVLIRDARLAKGYSAEKVASLMHVTTERVVAWEFGQETPSLPRLELLAYWLEVPVSHFMSGTQTLVDQLAHRSIDQNEYLQIRNRMIATQIRQAREDANFTLAYLAEQANMDENTLQRYEQGTLSIPLSELANISDALRVPVSHFLEGSDRIGKFLQAQEVFDSFLEMSPELREFVSKPANHRFIELAMKLEKMDTQKLRSIAEDLLEITL